MSRPARSLHNRRRRVGLVVLAAFGCATAALGQTLLPPDPSTTVGNVVGFDGFIDENGRALSTLLPRDELDRDPRPWIVSPMYTRCPHTCSAITAALRRALDQSGLAPAEYRVLSFSFDPQETDDGLREFRARMQLPPDWLTLRARDPKTLQRTLAALDFHTIAMDGGNFDHPNLVAILAPDMRLAAYLFGINFSAADLARTVRRARDGVSPVDTWRPYLFLFAALGFLASASVFVLLLSRRRARSDRDLHVPMAAGKPSVEERS
jgi:cytochrome oxidase Cu insertion factor (SCO1/SenC/PrrC family)